MTPQDHGALALSPAWAQKFPSLADTPPMGWAVAILNRGDEPKRIAHDWRKHAIGDDVSGHNADFSKTVYDVRDLPDQCCTRPALRRLRSIKTIACSH